MQGRLLPKYMGRYQAHPVNYWEKEFSMASELGLKYIEFIFDYNDIKSNPLFSERGLKKITDLTKVTSVNVKTVCADYFMEFPIHSSSEKISRHSTSILSELILQCSKIGISDIIIPCVDRSSLNSERKIYRFAKKLIDIHHLLNKCNINIALETDLNPTDFFSLVNLIDSPNIKVNYDLGNSSALDYKVDEEFAVYGNLISDIHIKDRTLNGPSVMLGTGNADFHSFFSELNKINFNGPIIMQAYRDDQGVEVFKKQLKWLKKEYNSYILKVEENEQRQTKSN